MTAPPRISIIVGEDVAQSPALAGGDELVCACCSAAPAGGVPAGPATGVGGGDWLGGATGWVAGTIGSLGGAGGCPITGGVGLPVGGVVSCVGSVAVDVGGATAPVVGGVVGAPGWGGRTETFETCWVVGGIAAGETTGVSWTGGAISIIGAVTTGGVTTAFVTTTLLGVGSGGSVVVGWAIATLTCGACASTGAAGICRWATAGRAGRG